MLKAFIYVLWLVPLQVICNENPKSQIRCRHNLPSPMEVPRSSSLSNPSNSYSQPEQSKSLSSSELMKNNTHDNTMYITIKHVYIFLQWYKSICKQKTMTPTYIHILVNTFDDTHTRLQNEQLSSDSSRVHFLLCAWPCAWQKAKQVPQQSTLDHWDPTSIAITCELICRVLVFIPLPTISTNYKVYNHIQPFKCFLHLDHRFSRSRGKTWEGKEITQSMEQTVVPCCSKWHDQECEFMRVYVTWT